VVRRVYTLGIRILVYAIVAKTASQFSLESTIL
jgi:hypothetical protein